MKWKWTRLFDSLTLTCMYAMFAFKRSCLQWFCLARLRHDLAKRGMLLQTGAQKKNLASSWAFWTTKGENWDVICNFVALCQCWLDAMMTSCHVPWICFKTSRCHRAAVDTKVSLCYQEIEVLRFLRWGVVGWSDRVYLGVVHVSYRIRERWMEVVSGDDGGWSASVIVAAAWVGENTWAFHKYGLVLR
jgi:hypothetical protein